MKCLQPLLRNSSLTPFISHYLRSHSLGLSHSSYDLPPPFFLFFPPSQPTTFLHPEIASSVTKAGKDGGRWLGRQCWLWPWSLTVWLGRAAVCHHGSVRRSMSIVPSVMGVPILNISESSAALPDKKKITIISWVAKTWGTKHKRKMSSLPTNAVEIVDVWSRQRVGLGTTSRVGEGGGGKKRERERWRDHVIKLVWEACPSCGVWTLKQGRVKVGWWVVARVCAFRLWVWN